MERKYEECELINAKPEEVFTFADNHQNFSSHMTENSWMMGGGKMKIETDEGHGQKVGSHIKMSGKVLGIKLYLDEVITEHEPPIKKVWKTLGDINLLVIGHYELGFKIEPKDDKSLFVVFINYDLPTKNRWLGVIFGKTYARWCVKQMIDGVKKKFN